MKKADVNLEHLVISNLEELEASLNNMKGDLANLEYLSRTGNEKELQSYLNLNDSLSSIKQFINTLSNQ